MQDHDGGGVGLSLQEQRGVPYLPRVPVDKHKGILVLAAMYAHSQPNQTIITALDCIENGSDTVAVTNTISVAQGVGCASVGRASRCVSPASFSPTDGMPIQTSRFVQRN
jgi:hypothetical protein